jgi:hypothetical protein
MAKQTVTCPTCMKKEISIYTSSYKQGVIENVKGAKKWYPMIKQISKNQWEQHYKFGLAVECKCGATYCVYNADSENAIPTASLNVKEALLFPMFCANCGQSYIANTILCPNCNQDEVATID